MNQQMSISGKLFIGAIIAVGVCASAYGVTGWHSNDLARLVTYLIITCLAARMNIHLPYISGTLSAGFLFVFIGVVELTLPESLLLGAATVLVQNFFPIRKSKIYQIAFSVANNLTSILVAYLFNRWANEHLIWFGLPLLLTTVAMIYFFFNTLPIAMVLCATTGGRLSTIWKQNYFWSFPFHLVGASVAGLMHIASNQFGWQVSLLILPLMYLIYNSYASYIGRLEDSKVHAEEMASLHLRTIEALALAIEAKDDITHAHLQRVQTYAVELARDLNLPEMEVEAIRAASILHDIGKLAVPEHIISKPGKLTPEEFEKMKIHPIVGAEILERVQFPYPVAPIVLSHHEKWDGTGYPYGQRGEEIPIGARILAAVDCLDALASDRQYRRALPLEEAIKVVLAEGGKSYDPNIVLLLSRRYKQLEELARNRSVEMSKLSKQLKIERGEAPAAGFEKNMPNMLPSGGDGTQRMDFLSSIAAARQEAQNLFELSQELGNSLSLSETLSLVASRLKKMVPFDALALFTLQDQVLSPEYVEGEDCAILETLSIPVGEGLLGWVAQNSKPIINGNPTVESGCSTENANNMKLSSALAVPLMGINGVVGVFAVYQVASDAFTRDHLRILQAVAGKLAFTVENAHKYIQAETSASIDYLTGLPNARAMFQRVDEELARSGRSGEVVSVMVCDLNGFKLVNDQFGHLTGNRLLRAIAEGLQEAFRQYDLVARLGGDEFVIVLPGMNHEDASSRITEIEKLVQDLGFEITGTKQLSISVGVSVYPQDGETVEDLLSEADRRMYQAKRMHHSALNAGGLRA